MTMNTAITKTLPREAQDTSLERFIGSITGNTGKSKDSLFLSGLPSEIRQHIYGYILPATVALRAVGPSSVGIAHVWLPGSTALMATCRQIHEEAAEILYGQSVFLVEVGYDTLIFRHRRLRDSGLVTQTTPPFLDVLSARNLRRIRYLAINVEHVDSYTGMLSYLVPLRCKY